MTAPLQARLRGVRRPLAVLILLAASAALAQAAGEPSAIADAHLGTLHVTSAVYVGPKSVDLMGVWQDSKFACTANRRMRIKGEVDYIPFRGHPSRPFVRTKTFVDVNCAEGGPNVGFTVTARKLGLACPNGTWKPARYNFLTRTTEPKSDLAATASVNWARPGHC
jgi:hypothetical protein